MPNTKTARPASRARSRDRTAAAQPRASPSVSPIKSRGTPPQSDGLRVRAEALLQGYVPDASKLSAIELARLVHELQVHQVELRMQNDELRRVRAELEVLHDRDVEIHDFVPVGCLALDDDGKVQEANRSAAELLGVNRAGLIGMSFADFVPPGSLDVFRHHRQRIFARPGKHRCTLGLRRSDGARFVADLESVVAVAKAGGARQCLIALSDATDRTRAEKELQENQARLAAIVESSEDVIVSLTLDGTITSWNRSAARLYGYTAEEAVGQSIVALIVPPDLAAEPGQLVQKLEAGEVVAPFETTRQRKDGSLVCVSITASPIRDGAGAVTGISAIVRDITRQKEMERALRSSEEALADFFAESPLGLVWIGPDGRVERINRVLLELLGRTSEDSTGAALADWFVKPQLAAQILRRVEARETAGDVRARLRHKDGTLLHVLIDANGLWRDGTYVHSRWFVRDITRSVELQREVLAVAVRERQRLGHDLHDDLCQQLSGIQFLSETLAGLLESVSKSGVARAREIGRLVRQSIDRARELAHGLSPVSLENDGLMAALRALAESTRRIFRRDCRFTCETPVVIPDQTINANLYHIAQEAVSNAIRHGKARRIELSLSGHAGQTVLTIRDNGIGLPVRVRKRPGMGLRVMQYRAGTIGAVLELNRCPAGGTEVVCTVGQGD